MKIRDWLGDSDETPPTGREAIPYLRIKLDPSWTNRCGPLFLPDRDLEYNLQVIRNEIDLVIPLLIRRRELFSYKQDGKNKENASTFVLRVETFAK